MKLMQCASNRSGIVGQASIFHLTGRVNNNNNNKQKRFLTLFHLFCISQYQEMRQQNGFEIFLFVVYGLLPSITSISPDC
jgi:hypothetical protein